MKDTVKVEIEPRLSDRARAIRQAVFVEEQGFRREFDDTDDRSAHALALCGDEAVGTARLFRSAEGEYTLGRVAVRKQYRGKGVGRAMLDALIAYARAQGARKIVLYAQTHAEGFYRAAGFERREKTLYEDGVEHVSMEMTLDYNTTGGGR